MRSPKYNGGILLLVMILLGCIEPYDPPLKEKDANYLVVDGFLNGDDGVATVKLSRSLPVKSKDPMPAEANAIVYVEDGNGLVHTLAHTTGGIYSGIISNSDPHGTYRLIIRAGDEHEYVSDFTTIVQTPPIDSVTWSVQRDGIRFEVNTHDATNTTRFFKWRFTETYEYHSRLFSGFMFASTGVVVPRPPELNISDCWKTNEATDIIVASTKHLQQSVLSKFPIALIPYGSSKLFVKYSLLLEQQGITEETYNYWLNLEKSTEHLGGLFDPLPSEVKGNIKCLRHEGEHALGIFTASTVTQTRIFLARNELPREQALQFFDRTICQPDTIFNSDLPNASASTLLVDAVYGLGPAPIGYTTAPPSCLDCTHAGGITTEPPFWK